MTNNEDWRWFLLNLVVKVKTDWNEQQCKTKQNCQLDSMKNKKRQNLGIALREIKN